MAHPEAGQCVQHRIGYCRWRRDRGHRPNPLRPEWVRRRWHLQRLQDEMRDLVHLRESIVQQAPRQWLALWTVNDIFAQGLPKALRDATDNLPFDQPWIDDAATVVHPNIAEDGDLPCLPTHLHDHGMRAKGERGSREGVSATENQPAFWRDHVGVGCLRPFPATASTEGRLIKGGPSLHRA